MCTPRPATDDQQDTACEKLYERLDASQGEMKFCMRASIEEKMMLIGDPIDYYAQQKTAK